MDATSRPRWNQRRFVSLGVLFSALALPVTGVGDHLARHSSGPHAGDEWVLAHVGIGTLFVVFATWHVLLNRHALAKYLRGKANKAALLSREALVALVLVGGVLALTVAR